MKKIIKINGQERILPTSAKSRQEQRKTRARGNVVELTTEGKTYCEFKKKLAEVMSREYGIFYTENDILGTLAEYYPASIEKVFSPISEKMWEEMVHEGTNPFLCGYRMWKKFTGDLAEDLFTYEHMDNMAKMFVVNPANEVLVEFKETI